MPRAGVLTEERDLLAQRDELDATIRTIVKEGAAAVGSDGSSVTMLSLAELRAQRKLINDRLVIQRVRSLPR